MRANMRYAQWRQSLLLFQASLVAQLEQVIFLLLA